MSNISRIVNFVSSQSLRLKTVDVSLKWFQIIELPFEYFIRHPTCYWLKLKMAKVWYLTRVEGNWK